MYSPPLAPTTRRAGAAARRGAPQSSLKAAGVSCATQADGFSPDDAAAGALAADDPAALQTVAADQAPLTLLQLPTEVLVLLFGRLDALARPSGGRPASPGHLQAPPMGICSTRKPE